MLRLRPIVARLMANTAMAPTTIQRVVFHADMKRNFVFCSRFFDNGVLNVRPSQRSLFIWCSKTRRVRNTAVKNEQMIPMIQVVAKPRIGPVPNI